VLYDRYPYSLLPNHCYQAILNKGSTMRVIIILTILFCSLPGSAKALTEQDRSTLYCLGHISYFTTTVDLDGYYDAKLKKLKAYVKAHKLENIDIINSGWADTYNCIKTMLNSPCVKKCAGNIDCSNKCAPTTCNRAKSCHSNTGKYQLINTLGSVIREFDNIDECKAQAASQDAIAESFKMPVIKHFCK
jgi:hypothetical protein